MLFICSSYILNDMFANLENSHLPTLKMHMYVKGFCEGKDNSGSSMKIFRAVATASRRDSVNVHKGLYRNKSLLWFPF